MHLNTLKSSALWKACNKTLSKLMCVRYSHRVVAAIDMCKFWRVYNSNFGTQLLYIANGEFCATISLHFLCAVLCHSDHWLAIVVRSTWCNSQLLQNQQPGENLQQRSFNFQTLETLRYFFTLWQNYFLDCFFFAEWLLIIV